MPLLILPDRSAVARSVGAPPSFTAMLHQKIVLLAQVLLVSTAALLGAIVALLMTAVVIDRAAFLSGTSLLVLCIINVSGHQLLARRRRNAPLRTVQALSTLVLVSIVYGTVLRPTASVNRPAMASVRYWALATGSEIAYLKLEPDRRLHTEPIVVLHGGPGVADLEGDAAFFGRLRAVGYTVYVYEQLGTGRSSRLADPRGYGVERDAADLEAIRTQLGAQQLILIGHSYGAAVAARYIARHGEHVSKLVVISPGAINDGVTGGDDFQSRLTPAHMRALYAHLLQPRSLTVYVLLQINPRAAYNFAGDAEMDARFAPVYAATAAALHCGTVIDTPPPDLGFYANQYPQSRQHVPPADLLPALRRSPIPAALVIKGSCDYLSWASAMEYVAAFAAGPAQIVYVRGAGHNVYQDQPQAVALSLTAFLTDRAVSNRYPDTRVPSDYEKGF